MCYYMVNAYVGVKRIMNKERSYKSIEEMIRNNGDIKAMQAVIAFLGLFLPVTLAKKLVSIILLIAGRSPSYITTLTGLCDRSVRNLKTGVLEGRPINEMIEVKGGRGRKSLTADVEQQIVKELEEGSYHTRRQIADMIQDKFQIKISVSAVGKLLKKTESGS